MYFYFIVMRMIKKVKKIIFINILEINILEIRIRIWLLKLLKLKEISNLLINILFFQK